MNYNIYTINRKDSGKQVQYQVLATIPAYNEQASILNITEQVHDFDFVYIVVNDGSVDKTREICEENDLKVLNLPQNLGIGGAVQACHKFTQAHNYDIDVQFDDDGQHDVRYLLKLVSRVQDDANVAIGSRFFGQNGWLSIDIAQEARHQMALLLDEAFHRGQNDRPNFRVQSVWQRGHRFSAATTQLTTQSQNYSRSANGKSVCRGSARCYEGTSRRHIIHKGDFEPVLHDKGIVS